MDNPPIAATAAATDYISAEALIEARKWAIQQAHVMFMPSSTAGATEAAESLMKFILTGEK